MRSRGLRLFFVGIFLVLTGCSYWHPGAVDQTIEEPYHQVFQATLEVLRERQFPIETINRGDGKIETGRRAVEESRVRWPVEKVTVQLERKEGKRTKAQLLLVFVDQADGNPIHVPQDGDGDRKDDIAWAAIERSIDTGVVYDDYLDAVGERAREREEK